MATKIKVIQRRVNLVNRLANKIADVGDAIVYTADLVCDAVDSGGEADVSVVHIQTSTQRALKKLFRERDKLDALIKQVQALPKNLIK